MQPTLVKGDYIIATKYSIGYGQFAASPLPFPVTRGRLFEREPERGDVIIFRPETGDLNFIKRVIGLPGDTVQMQDGQLLINGVIVDKVAAGIETRLNKFGREDVTNRFKETLPNGASHMIYDDIQGADLDTTDLHKVPDGFYFMLGDNRDHSSDSRVPVSEGGAGLVPSENLVGQARFVLLSVTQDFSIFKPWTWYHVNPKRFFQGIE